VKDLWEQTDARNGEGVRGLIMLLG